jgi:hypothetical protein
MGSILVGVRTTLGIKCESFAMDSSFFAPSYDRKKELRRMSHTERHDSRTISKVMMSKC